MMFFPLLVKRHANIDKFYKNMDSQIDDTVNFTNRQITMLIEDLQMIYKESQKINELIAKSVSSRGCIADQIKEQIKYNIESENTINKYVQEQQESAQQKIVQLEDILKEIKRIPPQIAGIKEISEQINLLALNAAIEAARTKTNNSGFI